MLMMIGILILVFLRELRLLSSESLRRIISIYGLTAAVGALYFLAGALLRQATYQDVESAAAFDVFFSSGYLRRVYDLLSHPAWDGVLTGAFIYASHAIGALLLGQYLFGGWVLAWGLTGLSMCFIEAGLRKIFGRQAAKDGVFLLFCAPGAVFLFLPGWPPTAMLAAALALYFLSGRITERKRTLPRAGYGLILAFLSLLSASVTAALVLGRIP